MQAVTEIEPLPDDLIAWVASQRAAGHTTDALRAALLQAGWDAELALRALASAEVSRPAPLPLTSAASASAAPGPDLRGTPLRIDAGDRRVAVLQTVALPRAVLFGDFLDDTECSALIELARGADLLLCEASFVDGEPAAAGMHLTGAQAGAHAAAAGVGRLLITHVPPWNSREAAVAEAMTTYAGPVEAAAPRGVYEL